MAGIVNIAGFLSVQKLTTNVTGHFAFFVDEILQLHFWIGIIYFFYIISFLLGAFIAGFMVEFVARKNENTIYIIPIITEIILMFFVALFGENLILNYGDFIACVLLFSMGLQNSLVTKISNSVVRTTHLTGLFTDLGIELSQLYFYKQFELRFKLYTSIKLRLTIILFFFLGGIIGGLFYLKLHLKVLLIAALVLAFGLIFDYIKLKINLFTRKSHQL